MHSWRYAASRNADGEGNISWNVRELYESDPGKPPAYTANAMGPFGETLQELRHDLRLMYADVLREDLPILDLARKNRAGSAGEAETRRRHGTRPCRCGFLPKGASKPAEAAGN